jgi:hypothetical protein
MHWHKKCLTSLYNVCWNICRCDKHLHSYARDALQRSKSSRNVRDYCDTGPEMWLRRQCLQNPPLPQNEWKCVQGVWIVARVVQWAHRYGHSLLETRQKFVLNKQDMRMRTGFTCFRSCRVFGSYEHSLLTTSKTIQRQLHITKAKKSRYTPLRRLGGEDI